jgi:cell division protein FtsI (penicillin-binding protein 3)
MKEFMVLVTEPGGTGTRARVAGYRVGGKTGTAQKVENGVYSPTARVSSFIGFAPADDPRVAITVMADTPTVGSKYGGIVSAPAFAQVAAAAMRHLRVPPTEELLTQKRPDASKKHLVETRTIWPPVDEASSTVKATPWAAGDYSQPALALRWSADRRLVLPDLRGLGLRDVLRLVQGSGLEVEILGSGRAVAHNPAPGATLASGDRLEVRFE